MLDWTWLPADECTSPQLVISTCFATKADDLTLAAWVPTIGKGKTHASQCETIFLSCL